MRAFTLQEQSSSPFSKYLPATKTPSPRTISREPSTPRLPRHARAAEYTRPALRRPPRAAAAATFESTSSKPSASRSFAKRTEMRVRISFETWEKSKLFGRVSLTTRLQGPRLAPCLPFPPRRSPFPTPPATGRHSPPRASLAPAGDRASAPGTKGGKGSKPKTRSVRSLLEPPPVQAATTSPTAVSAHCYLEHKFKCNQCFTWLLVGSGSRREASQSVASSGTCESPATENNKEGDEDNEYLTTSPPAHYPEIPALSSTPDLDPVLTIPSVAASLIPLKD
ncbi:cyclin b1 [Striga asiatica]|uniref:Cyclin b1 n=1 Tax=Striga asiatica TaxID=4170 RepID=A0A5A7RKG1_STRAF|nr:cyclin b1 [Striga asiatica]